MRGINRITSPMDLLDEGLDEPPDKVVSRKQFLREKQRTKSPFLIGSIEEINTRISQLDQKLQNYARLVCESPASDVNGARLVCESPASDVNGLQSTLKSSRESEQFQKRERDKKEVCQFAGIYTLKSAFLPNLSSRVKNISKISIARKENKTAAVSKEEAGKPKFVQLHLYPGFDPEELTPLPAGFGADDILRKVVQTSVSLNKKLGYKQTFEQLFFSQLSQSILLDTFWYMFLQQFQPDTASQQKLFNRVAHNYVHLLMNSVDIGAKDIFFKAYPKLMSQAVYSSFCHTFPDSYQQFGEQFRDDLVNLVYAWMAGIRPPPRSWVTWKMSSLEPPNMKQRDDMMNRKNNKKRKPVFDLASLEMLVTPQTRPDASSRSPSLSTVQSSTGSVKTVSLTQLQDGARKMRLTQLQDGANLVKHKTLGHLNSPHRSHQAGSSQDMALTKAVTAAKGKLDCGSVNHGKDVVRASKALSPIRELAFDDGDSEMQQKSCQRSVNRPGHKTHVQSLESHPVGRSCDYVAAVFDLHGRSPLVEHFLQLKGLNRDAGQLVWVHRVELENLPPLDAPTYKDIITSSSKSMRQIKVTLLEQQRNNVKAMRARVKAGQVELREHGRRQAELLADSRQVKTLSDLIIMEQRRSTNSATAGAEAALTSSMMSQELGQHSQLR